MITAHPLNPGPRTHTHTRSDADRVAGLLEANNIYNVKLLVNRVRPDMIQSNDMMSVKDVQVGGGGVVWQEGRVVISELGPEAEPGHSIDGWLARARLDRGAAAAPAGARYNRAMP